jgi:hypothetical protein
MMTRTRTLALLLAASGAIAACGSRPRDAAPRNSVDAAAPAAGVTPTTTAATTTYVPAATFQEVMDSVVDPAADGIWESVSYEADLHGTRDRRPQSAEEWHEVRRRAVVLIEAANLIAVPGRTVAVTDRMVEGGTPLEVAAIQHRLDNQHETLVAMAGNLRSIGRQLVDAADRHDVDAITQLGGTLDEVCETCHRAFWYPDDPVPPGMPPPQGPAASH